MLGIATATRRATHDTCYGELRKCEAFFISSLLMKEGSAECKARARHFKPFFKSATEIAPKWPMRMILPFNFPCPPPKVILYFSSMCFLSLTPSMCFGRAILVREGERGSANIFKFRIWQNCKLIFESRSLCFIIMFSPSFFFKGESRE